MPPAISGQCAADRGDRAAGAQERNPQDQIGPALAVAWGWLPGLLWIWFGNIFIGAIHDYLALTASVRYDGRSVQFVAQDMVGKRAGMSFGWFILFLCVLVVAAFGDIVAGQFAADGRVFTAFFLAVWVRKKLNPAYSNVVLIPAVLLWITVTAGLIWYEAVIIPTHFIDMGNFKLVITGVIVGLINLFMLVLNFIMITSFVKSSGRTQPVVVKAT